MLTFKSYEKALHETLYALGSEQLKDLIVVGGWCPYLYSKYVWKRDIPTLATVDIDFAVKSKSIAITSRGVFERLNKAGLAARKMDIDDINRIEFSYVDKKLLIKIDFVTSPQRIPTSQPSLKKPYVIISPLRAAGMAMHGKPLLEKIHYKDKELVVPICSPAAFIVSKGLLVEERGESLKAKKDLASIAFVLRFAPDTKEILTQMKGLKKYPEFDSFSNKMKELFCDPNGRGYQILAPYYREWNVQGESQIQGDIRATIHPLLEAMNES